MLRQISYRIFSTTNELCRASPSLAKLLTHENNFRSYRQRGIIFDEDSSYDEPNTFDAPPSRPKRRFNRDQDTAYDDDYGYDESMPLDNSSYRPRQRYSNSRSNFDDFDNRRSSRNHNESNYRNRNQFRNRDSFDQRPFRQSEFGFGSNYSRSQFGQKLVKPVFDVNNMPPVEKYFYVEHPDVTQRSMEDVESWRKGLSMSVKGADVPKPVTNFEELCLPDRLKKVVAEQNYSEPTPIQAQGWPIALSGRDMVGISQTGSGKTLVFVLPAIIHALNQCKSEMGMHHECKPQVLVMAPTRELVQQIMGVSETFSNSCGLSSGCAYGGASRNYQLRNLSGANICVATPGRLIDFVSEGLVNLQACTYLVLDEADRMLDMGFEPQIRQIVSQIRPDRQTLMWSATWPREIQTLAEDFLSNYVQVTVGAGELRANPKIEQNIHVVDEADKERRLHSLLQQVSSEEESKVLIFAQTKRKVDQLGRRLNSIGIPALCIHGDVSQSRRDQVLNMFRRQKSCVLIATDVAARGLDISDVQCVVNYDFPPNIEDYIHRIGRTARGDACGVAHSFFTYENEGVARDLVTVLKQANQSISPELNAIVSSLSRSKSRRNFSQPRRFDFRRREAAFY